MNGTPGWCSSPRDREDIKNLALLLSDARSGRPFRPAPFGPSRSSRMSRINETMRAVKDSLAAPPLRDKWRLFLSDGVRDRESARD